MAAPRKVGREKWSTKNDTWTDRNGDAVSGMREKGFTRGSAKGLTASDISGLVEVRTDNREAIANAIDRARSRAGGDRPRRGGLRQACLPGRHGPVA